MAGGVKPALDSFWALVRNWKQGKSSEHKLLCENGHLKANYSVDLGVWVPPTTSRPPRSDPPAGPQGPWQPGPCRQRQKDRREAERAASKAAEEVVQEVPAVQEVPVDISSEKATEEAVFEDHINMKETAKKNRYFSRCS